MNSKYVAIYVGYRNNRNFIGKVSVSDDVKSIKNTVRRGRPEPVSSGTDVNEFEKYINSSYKIIEYGSIARNTSGITSIFPHFILKDAISDSGENLINVRKRKDSDLFVINEDESYSVIEKINDFMDARNHAPIIQNAIFSGLVSTFDNVLAKTINFIIDNKPDILKESDIKVSLFDMSGEEDYKSIKSKLISDYVMSILLKSRDDQISWIENSLSVNIKSQIKQWSSFIEICERRNVYIHHDSMVTERYYEKASLKPKSKITKDDIGKRLVHSSSYISQSSDVLFEVATMLIQTVCRSIYSGDRSKMESMDDHANNAVFSQNMKERYKSAATIADFLSKNITFTKDSYAKMVTINYATSKYMMDDDKHAKRIVDAVDWSSSMPHFQLCVYAVRGENKEACNLIDKVVKMDLISVSDFKNWPVFRKLRKEEIFWDALKGAFGGSVSGPDMLLEQQSELVAEGG